MNEQETITLFSYDIKGQIIPSTSLPDELVPIADFPNRDSLQETDTVRTALEDRNAVVTEELSDQSEDEKDTTNEEENEESRDSDENSDSSSGGNNDDDITESGDRGEEDNR